MKNTVITDDLCNTVYLSSYLTRPSDDYSCTEQLYENIRKALHEEKITLRILSNTQDIWVRDFMPIQIFADRFWTYRYDPDYLDDYITDFRDVTCRGKRLFHDVPAPKIIADGGNIVKCDGYVIMTDKIFSENIRKGRMMSWIELRNSIGVDVVIIPREDDFDEKLGHADGMMRYICPGKVLLRAAVGHRNPSVRKLDKAFLSGVKEQFARQKPDVKIEQFDFSQVPPEQQSPHNWAYINFLRVGNLILMPALSTPGKEVAEDSLAAQQLSELTGCKVVPVPMLEFIISGGGALNCISWTTME